ncbi:MAG: thiamine pyrophosphate-binding protein [Actinobacteria bacterium]|nr:thiamine pyrophosphate-binding protein [Actinomycetota bacterium]
MTASGAARLVEALERLEVETVFGLPGVHNLPIWKALAASQIRLVGVRHEQAAVYAADGYARATGRLGVALVTSGPGAANALGATGEAMASGSPVLVVATDVPAALRRPGVYRGVLHETRDQTAMFVPVTKAATLVGAAEQIGATTLAAGRGALAAPAGPVYVGVPTDLLVQEVAAPLAEPPAPGADAPDVASLERAAELLASAARPLIWAGGGALRAGAGQAVGALAERLAAPVVTTFQGRGLLAPDHPCAVPGPIHAEQVGTLWDEADVVVAIGTDFDGMMTQNWLMPAPPSLIAINVDEREAGKNYPADVALVGDAARVVDALVPRVATRPGLPALRRRLRELSEAVAAAVAADEPQATALLDVMARCLPADAVVVADMCIPGYWLAGYRQVPAPRKLAYPVGWGTLGFAFPASLGAALAGAGPVVCVTGDGGFLFACGELATAVQEAIPVTVVLVDDGGYGMLRFDQQHAGDEPFGVDLARPDFAALAESFGVPATTVEGFGESFATALTEGIGAGGPRMIVVNARMKPPPTTSPRWYRRG